MSLVHIEDAVQALPLAGQAFDVQGEVFNIAAPQLLSVSDLVEFLVERGFPWPRRVPVLVA